MSSIDFRINQSDLDSVLDAVQLFPDNSEDAINKYLKETGAPRVNKSISNLIPVSSSNKKKHAKENNPLTNKIFNLGFAVKSKTAFNYLYFPDQGEGTSSSNDPLNFMENGLNAEYDSIIDGILKSLEL